VHCAARKLSATELAVTASLLQPAGHYGPAFLTTAITSYQGIQIFRISNWLFVGHLSDAWCARTVRDALVGLDPIAHNFGRNQQRHLTRRIGLYSDKIDGKDRE